MVGIISYAPYVPKYRLSHKVILTAMGWFNPMPPTGEKAVGNYDEDSLSMAAATAIACTGNVDRQAIDGLIFATTTAPYRERENAALIATALDLNPNIRTLDVGNSLKAGTGALLLARDMVLSGEARNVLVCAADCRLGKPGSAQERIFGDAASAVLIGDRDVIATFEGSYSTSYDFPDHRRAEFDKYDRSLEDRWSREEGYMRFIPAAFNGLLAKNDLKSGDLAKVAYPAVFAREHGSLAKVLGLQPTQLQDPLHAYIGDTGAASPLVMLAAALDSARPGDNIAIMSYGSGSDALCFKVTETITRVNRGRLAKLIAARTNLGNYEKYAAFRGILPIEVGARGEAGPTCLPLAWRDRKLIMALRGSRCKQCGTPQYPPQRVCVNPDCGSIDEMEDYAFADKKATLFTYTEDNLAFSISPPQAYGLVDFEGGGRSLFDITDAESGSLKVGMPMEMTFRRKYFDEMRGIYMYCWKAMPARG